MQPNGRIPGFVVILNGAPRAGKSSIVAALQARTDAVWINLGVDVFANTVTPPHLRPGIGLRPGGERPDIEVWLPALYAGLYESIAAHARLGFNVVADVGHHEGHSHPYGLLEECVQRLDGMCVLFVGVRCPIETIMIRRNASDGSIYAQGSEAEPVPPAVMRWQEMVHQPGLYDLEIDTSVLTPEASAEAILAALTKPPSSPSAFERLAALAQ
ncbi:chloramphenicol phosphotransferase CPT family protein [Oryzibacter oryziterrae]|uniref:chloramphenicol phosphotransferase CPT family protein n=1 Tax=Oryzibacter oryziterrae TaxID=2766474 RepID=UPI001F26132D|nr:chloramphenicol phosphotransferase [Oryzibacter oryziterrae]